VKEHLPDYTSRPFAEVQRTHEAYQKELGQRRSLAALVNVFNVPVASISLIYFIRQMSENQDNLLRGSIPIAAAILVGITAVFCEQYLSFEMSRDHEHYHKATHERAR
jgi:hypothetical protein